MGSIYDKNYRYKLGLRIIPPRLKNTFPRDSITDTNIGHPGGGRASVYFHPDGTSEDLQSRVLATANDEYQRYEEYADIHMNWVISPSSDGTVASPTMILDQRFHERLLFIDISSNAVTIKLPPAAEAGVGFKVKFILNESSEGEATKNFGIITDSTGEDIQGYIGGGAAMNVTANTSSVYWDTSDAAASSGDWCELVTDATGWYITGQAALANAIDIADGHDVTT
jgi:hypothetical protein